MNLDAINKMNIVLLCGLYGSGKTEFALKYFRSTGRYRISRSEIRKLMYEMTTFGQKWSSDKFNEEDDVLVKHVERKVLENYMHNKRNILIINTFMTVQSRARFVKIAKDTRRSIGAVFLDPPVEQCLEYNQSRPSPIPQHIITSMNMKKAVPTKQEGFDEVVVVTDFMVQ